MNRYIDKQIDISVYLSLYYLQIIERQIDVKINRQINRYINIYVNISIYLSYIILICYMSIYLSIIYNISIYLYYLCLSFPDYDFLHFILSSLLLLSVIVIYAAPYLFVWTHFYLFYLFIHSVIYCCFCVSLLGRTKPVKKCTLNPDSDSVVCFIFQHHLGNLSLC